LGRTTQEASNAAGSSLGHQRLHHHVHCDEPDSHPEIRDDAGAVDSCRCEQRHWPWNDAADLHQENRDAADVTDSNPQKQLWAAAADSRQGNRGVDDDEADWHRVIRHARDGEVASGRDHGSRTTLPRESDLTRYHLQTTVFADR
jgi:hypothetical protein